MTISPAEPAPIAQVMERLGLNNDDVISYGPSIAKIRSQVLAKPRHSQQPARLILVSAMTPTPAGEGKTTTTIGLGQAMTRLGQRTCLALREPSLGPCLGMKGGATGGGQSQLTPAQRINLHFTGDFHAITSAHNLLAALLDNHIDFGNELDIDPRRVLWRRVLDMNDRALRDIVIGLGGIRQGMPRETGFDITAASEVMAMLCLANDAEDLRTRLDRTLIAFTRSGTPVTIADLNASGAMLALLNDALLPNLVQSQEGTPALVHGGPFANIAHGCNSVIATKMAMHLSDWTLTEAGFGSDLGAEKFLDIKCQSAGLNCDGVVLVATLRALKMHGGVEFRQVGEANSEAVQRGLENLDKHIENVRAFGADPVVALNEFIGDLPQEQELVRVRCQELGVPFAVSRHFEHGGAGAEELARTLMNHVDANTASMNSLYNWNEPVPEKIQRVARAMYGAREVVFATKAQRCLEDIKRLGLETLPVCIAKTQSSLSDDPKRPGRPRDFEITVEEIQINSGAGFLVVLTGDIMRMPGLPRRPLAESMDLRDGEIVGLG